MNYTRNAMDFLNLETWQTKEESDFSHCTVNEGLRPL